MQVVGYLLAIHHTRAHSGQSSLIFQLVVAVNDETDADTTL